MRLGRISKTLVAAAALSLVLAGCTDPVPAPTETATTPVAADGGNVRVVEGTPFNSFNPNSVTGANPTNERIDAATHTGFFTVDKALNLVPNDKFGKVEKIKDQPLTVKYTINEGVSWSDGEAVSADDLFLQWAAYSGFFNDATLADDYSVKKGNAYFHVAGDHSGLAETSLPEISDDRRSMTLTYTTPFSDWETALGTTVNIPAHIVALRNGLIGAADLTALLREVPKGDPAKPLPVNAALRKIADFWNTGFDGAGMPEPSLALSNGPFLVKEITENKELVLTPNADYAWGDKPKLSTITVSYESDPDKQVAALEAGTADIISPPATKERTATLSSLESDGVQIQRGPGLGFEQLVVNFNGSLAKPDPRKAFLTTVPRQEIVEELAVPLDPAAKVLNSFLFRSVQSPYEESAANNGSKNLPAVETAQPSATAGNISQAKELLDGARPTVRILYNKDDSVRVGEYQSIAAAAAQAGFKVLDAGTGAKEWRAALDAGDFDVALFGWTSNPTGSVQVSQLFRTGAVSNLNNFSNTVVDQLTEQLAKEPDPAKQTALKIQIDKLVMEAGYGVPLFERTVLSATGPHATGVEFSPLRIGPWQSVAAWGFVK